jgi:hypothetical protein
MNTNHTYLETMSYWAPLDKNNKEEQVEKEINSIKQQPATTQKPKSNKWTRRVERQWATRRLCDQQNIIIDSGATSHFMSEDLNLPKTGPSQIEVFLPDDSKLQSTSKTQLPFDQLDPKAREANILSGLKKSLISVNKMPENGYTTIFQLGNQGVTIHKEGTLTIMTSEPPILQGCKAKRTKFVDSFNQPNTEQHTQTSSECIIPTIHWTNDQIPTCSSRLPTGGNVDQSHPSRKLQHMAITNHPQCSQTQPRIRGNPKGTYEILTPRNTIN